MLGAARPADVSRTGVQDFKLIQALMRITSDNKPISLTVHRATFATLCVIAFPYCSAAATPSFAKDPQKSRKENSTFNFRHFRHFSAL